MATQADGTVYINSSIDTDGMVAGGKEIEAAARRAAKTVQGIGDAARIALEKQTAAFVKSNQLYAKQKQKVEELDNQLKEMSNQKVETSAFKEIQKQIDTDTAKLNRLMQTQEEFLATGGKTSSTAYQRRLIQIDQLTNSIKEAKKEQDILIQAGEAYQAVDTSAINDKLIYESQRLQQMEESLNLSYDALKYKIQQYSEQVLQSAQNTQEANQANAEFGQVAEETAEDIDSETRYVGLLQSALNLLAKAAHAPISILKLFAGIPVNLIKSAANGIKNFAIEIKNLIALPIDGIIAIAHGIESVGNAIFNLPANILRSIISAIRSIGSAIFNLPINILHSFVFAIKQIPHTILNLTASGLSKISNAAKTAAKQIGSSLVSSLKKAKSAMLSFHKSTQKSNGSIGTGIKSILKYTIGIRSLYALFSKVRSDIKDGFQNLAQYSDETNKNISALMSSLTRLKNSLATAFNPILTVITPILTKFIDMLSQAATYVGMFFAALTGKNSFIKAVAVQEDYAASLGDTADNAKKALKYLSGLDEIRTFTEDKDEEGYQPPSPLDMFETVEIPDKIKDIAQWIKDMWKDSDFYDLGKALGEKLKNALDSIPWDSIKEKASKLGKSLATLINGFVEVPGLGESIGRTLAEAINTGFEFLNAFVHNLHWDSIGNFIADSINGFLKNIDWDLIYDTFVTGAKGLSDAINSFADRLDWKLLGVSIGKGINTIVDTINTFVDNTNWQGLGSRIATGLNSMFDTINPENLGKALSSKLKIIIDSAYGFVTTFDWKKFGTFIGKTIQGFFDNIDFAKAAQTLSKGITGALNGLTAAIQAVDWYGLGQKVKEFLVNIDWAGICDAAFKALGAALGGLALFIWGIIEDAWNSVVKWWNDVAYEDGKFTIKGLLNGILDALKNIGAWIKEHIFNPFIEGFKSVFGIHSPSTIMEEQGSFIIEGLLNGIVEAIKNIGSWIKEHIFQPFIDGFKSVFGIHSPSTVMKEQGGYIVSGLLDGILEKIKNIASWIKEHIFTPFIDGFKKAFGINSPSKVMKEQGGYIVSGLLEGLKDKWKEVTDWIQEKIKWITDKIGSITDKISSIGGNLFGSSSYSISVPSFQVPIAPSIPEIATTRIPYLATGAVIPPNAPFAAILGDQKNGKNLEMPENLLRKIVREESGNNGVSIKELRIPLIASGKQMLEVVITEAMLQQMASGRNPLELV